MHVNEYRPGLSFVLHFLVTVVTVTRLSRVAAASPAGRLPGRNPSDLYAVLVSQRFVDLAHAFGPSTSHWNDFPDAQIPTIFSIRKDGFKTQRFSFVGQEGRVLFRRDDLYHLVWTSPVSQSPRAWGYAMWHSLSSVAALQFPFPGGATGSGPRPASRSRQHLWN